MAATKSIALPEPDQLKKIYQDIGTTEEKIDVEVKTLVEWMRKQPHLPNPDGKRARTARVLYKWPPCRDIFLFFGRGLIRI